MDTTRTVAPASHSMHVGNPGGPVPDPMESLGKPSPVSGVSAAELEKIRQENADDDVLAPTEYTKEVLKMVDEFDVRAPTAEPDIRYVPNAQGEDEAFQEFKPLQPMEDVRPYPLEPDVMLPLGSDVMLPFTAMAPSFIGETSMADQPSDVLDFSGKIDGGGVKDSMVDKENKPMMALVPLALIRGCAKVLTYGAKKYAPNNWRRGMRWGEPADALLRHFFAWLEGENIDPESGLSHLAHCSANLAFLMHMEANPAYATLDDRPKVVTSE